MIDYHILTAPTIKFLKVYLLERNESSLFNKKYTIKEELKNVDKLSFTIKFSLPIFFDYSIIVSFTFVLVTKLPIRSSPCIGAVYNY